MSVTHIIKKYPNRRLYDTGISSYITIEDVRQMVLAGKSFQVCDAKTGKDLTRLVLVQIIFEQEQGESPILSTDLLKHLIGYYGSAQQAAVSQFLDDSIQTFVDQQPVTSNNAFKSILGPAPWSLNNARTDCVAEPFRQTASADVACDSYASSVVMSASGSDDGKGSPPTA